MQLKPCGIDCVIRCMVCITQCNQKKRKKQSFGFHFWCVHKILQYFWGEFYNFYHFYNISNELSINSICFGLLHSSSFVGSFRNQWVSNNHDMSENWPEVETYVFYRQLSVLTPCLDFDGIRCGNEPSV